MGKSKEKTMAIVKYDNKFNQLSLTNFRAIEMDLLMSLCSKTKEQDSRDVILTFEQIKNLSHYVPTSNQRFIQDLKSMNKKLMSLDFTYEDEHRVEQFVLFPDFVIDKDAHTLTVKVNEKFKFLLNELSGNFTRFELDEFTALSSSYSKALYRLLKQYRTSGWCRISVAELRDFLSVPKSYSTAIMNRDIINKAITELNEKGFFKGLSVEKIKSGKQITAYDFKFQQESAEKEIKTDSNTLTCPKCGKPLHHKEVNGNFAWVHLDGWKADAECDAIFNTVAEIKGFAEMPSRENQGEKKNSGTSSIADILGGLFRKR